MELIYIGNRPLNLTLYSGTSFYAYPNKRDKKLFMSEQDWHFSKHLKPHKKMFRVLDEEDKPEQEPKKKQLRRQDIPLEESKKDPTLQEESAVVNMVGGKLKAVGAAKISNEEKANKVLKKNTKIKRSKTKGNPTTK